MKKSTIYGDLAFIFVCLYGIWLFGGKLLLTAIWSRYLKDTKIAKFFKKSFKTWVFWTLESVNSSWLNSISKDLLETTWVTSLNFTNEKAISPLFLRENLTNVQSYNTQNCHINLRKILQPQFFRKILSISNECFTKDLYFKLIWQRICVAVNFLFFLDCVHQMPA